MGDSDKSDMVVAGTNGDVDGEGGVKTVNKRIIAQKVLSMIQDLRIWLSYHKQNSEKTDVMNRVSLFRLHKK